MEFLIKSSAILILFYACYKLFLQRDTFFSANRLFLLAGIVIALILPNVVIPIYVEYEVSQPIASIIMDSSTNPETLTTKDNAILANDNGINISLILWYIYGSGVLFFGIKFLIEILSVISLLVTSKISKRGSLRFVSISEDQAPFSFFNFIVLNPEHYLPQEQKLIIKHEKVHAKQLHTLDLIIGQLLCIVLWFNPFAWLYRKSLNQNLEFIADNTTQESTDCEKSYQELLLKTSVKGYNFALVNNFYNSLIKKRIVMLHKNRSKHRNKFKFAIILPLLGLFLMSFNTKTIMVEKEPPTPTNMNPFSSADFLLEPNQFSASKELERPNINPQDKTKSQDKIKSRPQNSGVASSFTKSKAKPKSVNGSKFSEMVIITKETTDAQLEDLKEDLSKKGISLNFKGIKRNKAGEITAIKISAKSENSEVNYASKDDDAIAPITISFDDDNISIGNSKRFKHKDGHIFVTSKGKHKSNSNVFFYSDDDDDDGDEDVNVFVTKGNKKHKIVTRGKSSSFTIHTDDDHDDHKKEVIIIEGNDGSTVKEVIVNGEGSNVWSTDEDIFVKKIGKGKGNFLFITNDDGEKPLIILDGKEITHEELDDLDVDNIETIEVLKGEKAKEKYGDKGKNGVIVITSK